jgi:hypothetical protein
MSRTRLLTLGLIACLVLALVYLASDISRQDKKQSALRDQISASTGTLKILPTPPAGAEARLTEARATYDTAWAGVSVKAAPTEVIKALLDLAEQSNFRVNPITTEQWSKRGVGNAVYRVLPISFSLDGKQNDIVKFIQALENEEKYPYLEIENVQLIPIKGLNTDNDLYDTTLKIRISIIERITAND